MEPPVAEGGGRGARSRGRAGSLLLGDLIAIKVDVGNG